MVEKKRIILLSILALAVFSAGCFYFIFIKHEKEKTETVEFLSLENPQQVTVSKEKEKKIVPDPSMETIKKKGCVADGVLFGYKGDSDRALKVINRSECQYLHRAVETWLKPPDFEEVADNMEKIENKNMSFGMFIAEAISTKEDYYYPAEEREFKFSEMCRSGSRNFWGEHTCKPSFKKEEYRKYLRHITENAIDEGIRVFLFGQIYYQENNDISNPIVPEIIGEMREYAAFQGVSILIGAQTNDITDEKYLRLFDFIEGGVGLHGDGTIENGPCFSRWWNKPGDWCWALLWHNDFSGKANNVILHFDWSGRIGDDMSTFALMDDDLRQETLQNLHAFFTSQNKGFLMPMVAVLPRDNGGCHGKQKRYYIPDEKYSCDDEDVINSILKKGK